MKPWTKYLLFVILIVVMVNFWLTYQDFPQYVFWIALIGIPFISSSYFSYKTLMFKSNRWRIIVGVSISSIVASSFTLLVKDIYKFINLISTDNETGLFLFFMLYSIALLLLLFLSNIIYRNKAKLKKSFKLLRAKN